MYSYTSSSTTSSFSRRFSPSSTSTSSNSMHCTSLKHYAATTSSTPSRGAADLALEVDRGAAAAFGALRPRRVEAKPMVLVEKGSKSSTSAPIPIPVPASSTMVVKKKTASSSGSSSSSSSSGVRRAMDMAGFGTHLNY
jgi:hypothetical protein